MTLSGLLLFAGVYFAAVATPGPGLAAIVARALARGMDGTPAFIAGFVCGDLALFFLSAAGLAALAQSFAGVFTAVRLIGAAYLLYVAWKIWNAPVEKIDIEPGAETVSPKVYALKGDGPKLEKPWRVFLGSFTLTLGNPKPILFFLSIMPLVVDTTKLTPGALASMAVIITVIISAVLTTASVLATRARMVFQSPLALGRINKGTAIVLAGAAAAIATR